MKELFTKSPNNMYNLLHTIPRQLDESTLERHQEELLKIGVNFIAILEVSDMHEGKDVWFYIIPNVNWKTEDSKMRIYKLCQRRFLCSVNSRMPILKVNSHYILAWLKTNSRLSTSLSTSSTSSASSLSPTSLSWINSSNRPGTPNTESMQVRSYTNIYYLAAWITFTLKLFYSLLSQFRLTKVYYKHRMHALELKIVLIKR